MARRTHCISHTTRAYIRCLQHDPCVYCNRSPLTRSTIDHIEPFADRQGCAPLFVNHWPNLTAACDPCNREKDRTRLLAFLAARQASTAHTTSTGVDTP